MEEIERPVPRPGEPRSIAGDLHGLAVSVVLVGRGFIRNTWVIGMRSESFSEIAGSAEVKPPDLKPIVAFHDVSKWYGNVIGLNKLTLRIPAGVTGLLGPNGAGKSTFLQLATGQLRPSQGVVEVLGQSVWNNPGLNRQIGL